MQHNPTYILPTESSASQEVIRMLNDALKRLRFSGDELQRMENEGGYPLSTALAIERDDFFRSSQRMKKLLLHARKALQPVTVS